MLDGHCGSRQIPRQCEPPSAEGRSQILECGPSARPLCPYPEHGRVIPTGWLAPNECPSPSQLGQSGLCPLLKRAKNLTRVVATGATQSPPNERNSQQKTGHRGAASSWFRQGLSRLTLDALQEPTSRRYLPVVSLTIRVADWLMSSVVCSGLRARRTCSANALLSDSSSAPLNGILSNRAAFRALVINQVRSHFESGHCPALSSFQKSKLAAPRRAASFAPATEPGSNVAKSPIEGTAFLQRNVRALENLCNYRGSISSLHVSGGICNAKVMIVSGVAVITFRTTSVGHRPFPIAEV